MSDTGIGPRGRAQGRDGFHHGLLGPLERLADEHADIPQLRACVDASRELARRYHAHQLQRRVHESFDAFRTLKLIHGLTAARWPKLEWAEALRRAPFIDLDPRLPIDEQRRLLTVA